MGNGGIPGHGGDIAADLLIQMEAVPGQGVPQEGGPGVLDGGAGGDNKAEPLIGQDAGLDAIHDPAIHGHLVLVVLGEILMGAICLVGPGHVPHQLGRGIDPPDIVNEGVQIGAIGAGHAALAGILL